MKQQIEMMEEFHRAFGHPINRPDKIVWDTDFVRLRTKLHQEECIELEEELWNAHQNGKNFSQPLERSFRSPICTTRYSSGVRCR